MLKKRETTTTLHEIRTNASTQEFEKENLLDYFEHDASANLSKKRNTTKRKLIKVMDSMCFFYELDLQNLVKKYELGSREYISSKVEIILADLPYHVRINLKDVYSDYYFFSLENIKDVAKMIREVTKPEALADMFCTALKFSIGTEVLH